MSSINPFSSNFNPQKAKAKAEAAKTIASIYMKGGSNKTYQAAKDEFRKS